MIRKGRTDADGLGPEEREREKEQVGRRLVDDDDEVRRMI
jgi:hypothetical protein